VKRFCFFVLGWFLAFGLAEASNPYINEGDKYFAQRAHGAHGDRAQRSHVLTSIALYRYALTDPDYAATAEGRILKAYYFQGCYAYVDAADRLRIHTEAIEFGARYFAQYPQHPAIGYWYAVNLSLWAKERGALQAVKEGVAERIRRIAETMVSMTELNLSDQAGAYQILGRMHQLLPRIPLILTWPDKKLAETYLRKSISADPSDLTGYLFLGELLRDQGRHLEAAQLIYPILHLSPRADARLEDSRSLWKLRQLSKSLRLSNEERLSVSMRLD